MHVLEQAKVYLMKFNSGLLKQNRYFFSDLLYPAAYCLDKPRSIITHLISSGPSDSPLVRQVCDQAYYMPTVLQNDP